MTKRMSKWVGSGTIYALVALVWAGHLHTVAALDLKTTESFLEGFLGVTGILVGMLTAVTAIGAAIEFSEHMDDYMRYLDFTPNERQKIIAGAPRWSLWKYETEYRAAIKASAAQALLDREERVVHQLEREYR